MTSDAREQTSIAVDSGALQTTPPARIVHRLAVLSVCLIWPLIWVGGLVTTYDAGMAVPDWPGTSRCGYVGSSGAPGHC